MIDAPQQALEQASTPLSDVVEIERLVNKFYLFKNVLGRQLGLEGRGLAGIRRILDLRCGPGVWAMQMAQAYPHVHVIGVDERPAMIEYARTQKQYWQLDNLGYCSTGQLFQLPFSDKSFDMVFAPFLSNALTKETWPLVLQQCWRLLRPGGMLRLVEYELGTSNAPAHQTFLTLFAQAMAMCGGALSTGGGELGFSEKMPGILREQGFTQVECLQRPLDYSNGAPYHGDFVRDFLLVARNMQSLIIKMEVESPKRVAALYGRQQRELRSPGFRAELPLVELYGVKGKRNMVQPRAWRQKQEARVLMCQ